MKFDSWFQCINGCSGRYGLNEIIYNCPECGDLFEVTHDIDELKTHSAQEWKDLFDERYRRHDWPYGSSIWGKKELVCPNVDNKNIVSMKPCTWRRVAALLSGFTRRLKGRFRGRLPSWPFDVWRGDNGKAVYRMDKTVAAWIIEMK